MQMPTTIGVVLTPWEELQKDDLFIRRRKDSKVIVMSIWRVPDQYTTDSYKWKYIDSTGMETLIDYVTCFQRAKMEADEFAVKEYGFSLEQESLKFLSRFERIGVID